MKGDEPWVGRGGLESALGSGCSTARPRSTRTFVALNTIARANRIWSCQNGHRYFPFVFDHIRVLDSLWDRTGSGVPCLQQDANPVGCVYGFGGVRSGARRQFFRERTACNAGIGDSVLLSARLSASSLTRSAPAIEGYRALSDDDSLAITFVLNAATVSLPFSQSGSAHDVNVALPVQDDLISWYTDGATQRLRQMRNEPWVGRGGLESALGSGCSTARPRSTRPFWHRV